MYSFRTVSEPTPEKVVDASVRVSAILEITQSVRLFSKLFRLKRALPFARETVGECRLARAPGTHIG